MKCAAFRSGLNQLKSLHEKILVDPSVPCNMPSFELTEQSGNRKFKALDKDLLQREEEDNNRLMAKKMRQDENMNWFCNDCDWKGMYAHKAKGHARICGQRKRYNPRKKDNSKYKCSFKTCVLSFSSQPLLSSHYRYKRKYVLTNPMLKSKSRLTTGFSLKSDFPTTPSQLPPATPRKFQRSRIQ